MEYFILFGLPLIIIIMVISSYNSIIKTYNIVKRSWADVNTYERQKVNILDSLEPLVSQYTSHESSTMKDITALRQNILNLDKNELDTDALSKVQQGTDQLIKGLSVTVESYPDLKANTIFLNLMTQIKSQNENVGAAISIYNRNVEMFNSKIESIPTNIVNGLLTKKTRVQEFKDSSAEKNIEYQPNF